MTSNGDQQAATQERIALDDPHSVRRWTTELNVTEAQLREAVGAVGDGASDVEWHLKGSRSSTNEDVAARS